MPTYELCILFRTMPKNELAGSLKRVANAIFDRDGLIRKIENMGHRALPYKTSVHGSAHREAHYFLYTFDSKSSDVRYLNDEYKRDVDVIRGNFFKIEEKEEMQPCTLHEEMLPPMYRPDVKKMLDKRKDQPNPFTYKFHYNSGLDYYPFQR